MGKFDEALCLGLERARARTMLLRLKANPSHPTYKKVERLIGLLENIQLDLEWVDGVLKVRDHELAVSFDIVSENDSKPISDMPPIFLYKLTRDKQPNPYCKCRYCDPKFATKND